MAKQMNLNLETSESKQDGPVTCLGIEFPNDDARRAHFTELLREKLKDPEFRATEGFPIGEDKDILTLSDPPYYTACPNPWVGEFIDEWEAQKPEKPEGYHYHREPFAVDVSEGKTHAVYKAHSYHTKVPHLAIVPSILHYTEPGDIVLDGFNGSGMTGVAAQWCDVAPVDYRRKLEQKWKEEGHTSPKWGPRKCVLNDLSPAATSIAANYNLPFYIIDFLRSAEQILAEVQDETRWMYETLHEDGKTKAKIEHTVWSEIFTCPECAGEVVFLEEALDQETKKVADEFSCPHCSACLTKRTVERRFQTDTDKKSFETWKHITFRPVQIVYKIGKQKFVKKPDAEDLEIIKKIDSLNIPAAVPGNRFPIEEMYHGSRIAPKGFTHIHHFFLPRAAQVLGLMWEKIKKEPNPRLMHMMQFWFDSHIVNLSIQNRYRPHVSFPYNPLSGVYYISSLINEASPFIAYSNKLKRLIKAFENNYFEFYSVISTSGTSNLTCGDDSIDYIFTDPPFGENIFYADLNYLVESWYGVTSNTGAEAIVDKAKNKGLPEYQELMRQCFAEYHRVLKSGRWITIVFHNSKNAVWNAIQEALESVGFVVADVRAMDKKQGSYRQVTSSASKQDLVISAYKPNGGLEGRFNLTAGDEDGVWDFVQTHLGHLPVFVNKEGRSEIIAERTPSRLYDRMVAFHVQRNITIPLSASEFYQGIVKQSKLFNERDGMCFLPHQTLEYDKKRALVEGVEQLQLFVTDEDSARQWLQQQLKQKPQSFQSIHPYFMKKIGGWNKAEKPLELMDLLEENFLCYKGNELVPDQIHSYLSSNWKDMRNLEKDDSQLMAKAKERWYVPDPNKAADLEKLRERSLLKEFETYKVAKKKLKVFRIEAVRAGFKKAWQEKDFATIVAVAAKVPAKIIEDDQKLFMWYDNSVTRLSE